MARSFGRSWWGNAWVEALEHRAHLDPNRLPRGRTYARHDRVARLDVEPGAVTALVRGSRALPYRVVIGVRTFDDATWDRLATVVAQRAAHSAALLDGDLDPAIVAEAEAVDVHLMPGPGDLQPRCSCPDWADPCKHAAAVCYLIADELDRDPFTLFLLRGRSRNDLLAATRLARMGQSPSGSVDPDGTDSATLVDPGVPARGAWLNDPSDPPGRPPLPAVPGVPSAWPDDPPADAPVDAAGLNRLAVDAARRAWDQLATGEPSALGLDRHADRARWAAALLEAGESIRELARADDETPTQLAHRAAAWNQAGVDGLAAADQSLWRPPAALITRAIAAFAEAGAEPGDVKIRSNRITFGDVQLRVTEDGRWWRYERRGRSWDLVEPPTNAPEDLVST